jgi:muramidase (phage lysozyme)
MTVILPVDNLPREARALLIAIAQGESDPSASHAGISPYFILYGGGSFEGLPDRPEYNGFPLWAGKNNSHAAGRYQFEPATWRGTCANLFPAGSAPKFRHPADQDWGAWLLAQSDYHSRTGANLLTMLRYGKIAGIGSALRATWTSLSDATFPARYNAALAAVVAAEGSETPPTPTPTPEPAPPPVPAGNPIADILAAPRFQTGVQAFQRANGLVADGIIGPATLAKIGLLTPMPNGEVVEMTLADIIADFEDSVKALKEYEALEGKST